MRRLLIVGVALVVGAAGSSCGRSELWEPDSCGDGVIDRGEECDDGNRTSFDGCDAACQLEVSPSCGDGVLDSGEECDDGNRSSGDGCDTACRLEGAPSCGDGVVGRGEECDDGNRSSGDGCRGDCLSDESCGNGLRDWFVGEECDDGNLRSGDGCDAACRLERPPSCGNGVLDRGEECDDGNLRSGDGCDASCRREAPPGCGNGLVDVGEACDDGNRFSGDGCSGDCLSDESCGNGYLDLAVGEACDDGNLRSGDGCSASCQRELLSCGDGVVDPGEACDDGNVASGDGCSGDCLSDESCGNGYVDALLGEACDDGNVASGDGCSGDCLSDESCGNGVLDGVTAEECDDGNRRDGDGCDMDCRLESCDPDVELGVLPLGVTVSQVLDVGGASDDEAGCGDGPDMVVSFALGAEADLLLEIGQTGDHAFGMYFGGGLSCTEAELDCLDPGGLPSASTQYLALAAGSYLLVVESFEPDSADTAWIWLTASWDDPGCGDGLLDAGEACDDGNRVSGDGCSADCLSDERCGNGYLDWVLGEACDDGNVEGGDGCSADCLSDESCGNGIVDLSAGEVCDDGNRRSGDGCSASCLSDESCGNGIVDRAAGEVCDDGNRVSGDGCDADCQVEAGLCYVDDDAGILSPGEVFSGSYDVSAAGDEWVTGCAGEGQEVVLRFELERHGDVELLFTQTGDHSYGLYTDTEVTDVCSAVGGVCFAEDPGAPGGVVFLDRDPGVYYVVAEAHGSGGAGSVSFTIFAHGCLPDAELGLLRSGTTASRSVDTRDGSDLFRAGCAASPSGREQVLAFSLDSTRDVTLSWTQTGDHVFALLNEEGGECDEHQIGCEDPTGATTGSVSYGRLPAGDYLVMVEAYSPGQEGVVELTVEAR